MVSSGPFWITFCHYKSQSQSKVKALKGTLKLPPLIFAFQHAASIVNVGSDIIAPEVADKLEEVLLVFRDILLISAEIEKLKSSQTNY